MQDIILNCENITGGQTCKISASEPFVVPFFSSGDMMIAVMLFIIIFLMLINLLKSGIGSVSVIRKYQGNNSPDGKEFYKL